MRLLVGDGRFAAGLVVGYFAGLVTPSLARSLPDLVRPAAKVALKGALLGWERSREAVALLLESLEDVVAEVKAEVDAELAARRAPTTGDAGVNTYVGGIAASSAPAPEHAA